MPMQAPSCQQGTQYQYQVNAALNQAVNNPPTPQHSNTYFPPYASFPPASPPYQFPPFHPTIQSLGLGHQYHQVPPSTQFHSPPAPSYVPPQNTFQPPPPPAPPLYASNQPKAPPKSSGGHLPTRGVPPAAGFGQQNMLVESEYSEVTIKDPNRPNNVHLDRSKPPAAADPPVIETIKSPHHPEEHESPSQVPAKSFFSGIAFYVTGGGGNTNTGSNNSSDNSQTSTHIQRPPRRYAASPVSRSLSPSL